MVNYFVKVIDSKEVRRDVLEGSKETIAILRTQDEIAELRARKRELHKRLRRETRELSGLLVELEAALPQLTKKELDGMFPKPPAQKATKMKDSKGKKKEAPELPKLPEEVETNKLRRLESALSTIEERLSRL